MFNKTVPDLVTDLSELGCYFGCTLSLLIAINLLKMGQYNKLTFVNKMLIVYYAFDAVIGTVEVFFLFKLKRER